MNVKRKRKALNVAFKQFQRLPDFSRLKTNSERPISTTGAPSKSPAARIEPEVSARSLTE
jgi:hypothetical protein